MDCSKTYESDYCDDDYSFFIKILEDNDEIFNQVFSKSLVSSYTNGPYIKIKMTDILISKIKKCMDDTIISSIQSFYNKMIAQLTNTLSEYFDYTRVSQDIDVYLNDNAGLQVCLDYYLIVNEKTINKVVNEYNAVKTEVIDEPQSIVGYLLSFVY